MKIESVSCGALVAARGLGRLDLVSALRGSLRPPRERRGAPVWGASLVVTGLALYALYEPRHWFYRWFMPLNDLIGIPYVRLVHLIGMWCFIIFAMIHVYLSILSGNVDRDGTISSMFSGGRWLRKGVKFRDE